MVRETEAKSDDKGSRSGDVRVDGCRIDSCAKTKEGQVFWAIFQLAGRVKNDYVVIGVNDCQWFKVFYVEK